MARLSGWAAEWARLETNLRQGLIGRRDFLAGAAALGVAATTASQALAQTPKRGGALKLGLNSASTTDSLDPATWRAEFMNAVGPQLHDCLVRLDEKVTPLPAIAVSWEPSPDAKVWVFKLRKGVTFHNGKSVTAADVVASIEHHRGPNSKSNQRSLLAEITDVKATAPDEVTFTLRSGNADMPYILADIRLVIFPEGSDPTKGVGAGAFMLESFEPGVRVRVKRNPNDYRTDRGYVDTVETIGVNDAAARISGLLSGSLHIINKVDPNSVGQMQKNPNVQFFNAAGSGQSMFGMLCDASPYDNADLRLAMKYAIDRQAILRTVQHGYGKLGNDHSIPSFDPFYAADIPQRPYDPDKAKFHYKKSGHSGALTLTVADIAFSGATETAQLYQAAAKKAGIDLQVDRVPNDGYWDTVWQKRPLVAASWSGQPTCDIMLTNYYYSQSRLNGCHWKRADFDQTLVAARGELDRAKRKQMYHDLQMMIWEDGGYVLPVFFNNIDAGQKSVHGFALNPSAQLSGYRAPEMVWLA